MNWGSECHFLTSLASQMSLENLRYIITQYLIVNIVKECTYLHETTAAVFGGKFKRNRITNSGRYLLAQLKVASTERAHMRLCQSKVFRSARLDHMQGRNFF